MASKSDTSITTLDDAPKAAVAAPVAVVLSGADEGDQLSGTRVVLTIHPGEGENGRDPVFVGLNGTHYQVPRGVPVNVPSELIEILDNAKPMVYENNGGTAHVREVQRFGYSARAA